jgi:hypothetical protein
MNAETTETEALEDTLAEGIAAVMAAETEIDHPEDLADLFLEELNRLWADPAPLALN